MKKPLFLFLTLWLSASATMSRLPGQFQVRERFLSLTSTFDVNTEQGEPFITARKRFFSLTSTFDLEDRFQTPLATASSRFFVWGTVADVVDPSGRKIGWIEEELFRILPWAEYRVFNHQNQLVAIAKMNFWGTEFEIYHPDDERFVFATIGRSFFRCFRDDWTVQINNFEVFEEGIIDPRLLVILAIYQTDKDNRDRMRREVLDQLTQDQDYYDNRRFE